MDKQKTIFLLIGPKGGGKSFVGGLFEEYFDIPFIPVEDWLIKSSKGKDFRDESHLQASFETIESGIRENIRHQDKLVFESTGLSQHFNKMLNNLHKDHKVVPVFIYAGMHRCLQRIRKRDQDKHIYISEEDIIEINHAVMEKDQIFEHRIDNTNKSIEELLVELKIIIGKANIAY
jgi:shikimate kinase